MKNWIRKIWGKIVAFLCAIPSKYLLGFIFGLVVSAFITIVIPKFAEWAFVPVFFFCAICAFIDNWNGKAFRWKLWLSILLGAGVIQLFVILPVIF